MVRFRVEPDIRAGGDTTFKVAYEQRLHYASGASGIAAFGILPSEASTPFRVEPLVWRVTASENRTWRHEIDRVNAQVHVRRPDLTIGRQAIGWGRVGDAELHGESDASGIVAPALTYTRAITVAPVLLTLAQEG